MSADTPTPERVTLTDEEMRVLGSGTALYGRWATHAAAFESTVRAVETILATREQALREEIATRAPQVELDSALGEPTQCRVWIGGALVFDGLSRDAFLNDPTIARGGAR